MEREITFKSHPFPGAAAGLLGGGGDAPLDPANLPWLQRLLAHNPSVPMGGGRWDVPE